MTRNSSVLITHPVSSDFKIASKLSIPCRATTSAVAAYVKALVMLTLLNLITGPMFKDFDKRPRA